jgi:hypothetical protein
MEQDQRASRSHRACFEEILDRRRRWILRRVGDEDHVIGLPQTALRPLRRFRIGFVDDDPVAALVLVEPCHECRGAGIVLRELRCSCAELAVDVRGVEMEVRAHGFGDARHYFAEGGGHAQRHDGDARGGGVRVVLRPLQPADLHAHEIADDLRMQADDLLERLGRELDHQRVTNGNHVGVPRLAREEAHLADALARRCFAEDDRRAVGVRADDLQPPADQDAHAVARVSLAEERVAADHVDPFRERLDRRQRLRAERSEKARHRADELFVSVVGVEHRVSSAAH